MARIKNFLTPQWLKEFEEMKRQAAASNKQKRQASSDKQQVTSYKLPGPRPISNSNKGLIHKRQAKPEPSSGSQKS